MSVNIYLGWKLKEYYSSSNGLRSLTNIKIFEKCMDKLCLSETLNVCVG